MGLHIESMKKKKRKSYVMPVTVRITKETHTRLEHLLDKHQIDKSALIRRGIENMIEELTQKFEGEKAA